METREEFVRLCAGEARISRQYSLAHNSSPGNSFFLFFCFEGRSTSMLAEAKLYEVRIVTPNQVRSQMFLDEPATRPERIVDGINMYLT